MWVADRWKDYEVLDTSDGEKLERFGEYRLIRPDPQVIWKQNDKGPEWDDYDGYYHRSPKGGGAWEMKGMPGEWSISYPINGRSLMFRLKPFSFKHTGIFPEQATNWEWMTERLILRTAGNAAAKVLNLFAYTGGATLAAAAAGAAVTHVDASKGMVGWAKENAAASGLGEAPVRWLVDDCVKFVEREIRRGNVYDGIVMDPPSYGRGPKGETWKMEEGVYDLIRRSVRLLSDAPSFFLISSYTTGLQPAVLTYMLETAMKERYAGTPVRFNVEADEVGLPVTSTHLVLPCGASGRVSFI